MWECYMFFSVSTDRVNSYSGTFSESEGMLQLTECERYWQIHRDKHCTSQFLDIFNSLRYFITVLEYFFIALRLWYSLLWLVLKKLLWQNILTLSELPANYMFICSYICHRKLIMTFLALLKFNWLNTNKICFHVSKLNLHFSNSK